MITTGNRGSQQLYQHQNQYFASPSNNSRFGPQRGGHGMMAPTSSHGQIYYGGGGQWRYQPNTGQLSNLEPRRSSYGDLSSSGSGNFQGDCGGGFRYSSTEDLFNSQVQVAGGVTTPSGSSLFLFCPPKPRMNEDTTFDLRAATEQLIDRTQQLQSSTRGNNQVQYNNTSHAPRNKFGEWAI